MKGIIQLIVFIICGAVGIYFLAIHFKIIMAIIGTILVIGTIISISGNSPDKKSN